MKLTELGCRAWKNQTGTAISADGQRVIRYGCPGSPDIIGITKDGKFLGVEVKAGRDIQRPKQVKFMEMVRRQNGIYILARSVDDVVQFFQKESGS